MNNMNQTNQSSGQQFSEEQNQRLKYFRWLSTRFSVIPISPTSKAPIEKGWQKWCLEKRPFQEFDFIKMNFNGEIKILNAGVATGPASGVIVVDIDDSEKFKQWTKARDIENPLPSTFTVKSGGKSDHYYYQYPRDGNEYKKRNINGIFDVLGIGAQAIAPGSVHPKTGNRYTIKKQLPIAEAPKWVLELLLKKNKTPEIQQEQIQSQPEIKTIPQINLQTQNSSTIFQGERNSQLASLAGTMREKGMSPEAIEAALLKENSVRCNPPLDEAEIMQISKSICQYKPGEPQRKFKTSELGNAERLISKFGDDLLYCPQKKSWYTWTGRRWKKDESKAINIYAKITIREIYQEAALLTNTETKKKLFGHALKSESKLGIENMLELSQSEQGISVHVNDFDNIPYLLNCLNGTIDLRTGNLESHNRKDLLTHMINVHYNKSSDCPKFKRFIDQIMNNNGNLVSYVRKIVGYSLTGYTREQCYFVFYGSGSNGKSTLLNVLRELLGSFVKNIDFNSLTYSGHSARGDLARLIGARVVTCVEVEPRKVVNETVINRITGGDPITVKKMYCDPFEYIPRYKIIIAGNDKPNLEGLKHATWRRIRLIPFSVQFEKGKGLNDKLTEELLEELPGILTWAVEGCLEWQKEGLEPPKEVEVATSAYRVEKDNLIEFLKEACVANPQASVKSVDLYASYQSWCIGNDKTTLGKKNFAESLRNKGFNKVKMQGAQQWIGIETKPITNMPVLQGINQPVVTSNSATPLPSLSPFPNLKV
jgi:putative DNA primase/helicase